MCSSDLSQPPLLEVEPASLAAPKPPVPVAAWPDPVAEEPAGTVPLVLAEAD